MGRRCGLWNHARAIGSRIFNRNRSVLQLKGKNMDFTLENVTAWLGSDITKAEIIDILKDVANGVYRPEQLKQDIQDYIEA
jgi:hypothetical protein